MPQPAGPASSERTNRRLLIVLGVIIALILVELLGLGAWYGVHRVSAKGDTRVTLSVTIDNSWTATSTPIVAHMKATDGKTDVYHALWPKGAKSTVAKPEFTVPRGTYQVTFISPINHDRSIYSTGKPVNVRVGDKPVAVANTFTHVDAADVTPQQIQAIVDDLKRAQAKGDDSFTSADAKAVLKQAQDALEAAKKNEGAARNTPTSSAPSPAPSSSAPASGGMPAGGTVPADAIVPVFVDTWRSYAAVAPSKQVGCDFREDSVVCVVFDTSVPCIEEFGGEQMNDCLAAYRGDTLAYVGPHEGTAAAMAIRNGEPATTMEPGKTYTNPQHTYACHLEGDGVTCWKAGGQGFFLNTSSFKKL
ncbi:MAG: hypothetical protein E7A62_02060 [Actinomycetaceae bacterium]|nr:hypothetical protein [Actinomycetaceae bacterium]MDU0969764.1 hypothetical protein [Actinomycetaceae bacterium]